MRATAVTIIALILTACGDAEPVDECLAPVEVVTAFCDVEGGAPLCFDSACQQVPPPSCINGFDWSGDQPCTTVEPRQCGALPGQWDVPTETSEGTWAEYCMARTGFE